MHLRVSLACALAGALTLPAVTHAAPLRIRTHSRVELSASRRADGLHVHGALADDAGQPMPGQIVHVSIAGLRPQDVTTDRAGSFELVILAGDVRTIADLRGTEVPWRASFDGDASHGPTEGEGTLDLSRTATHLEVSVVPHSASIEAAVVQVRASLQADGAPLSRAAVSLRVGGGPSLAGRTDGEGRVTFAMRPAFLREPGLHDMTVAFAGDHRHAPCEARSDVRLLLPARLNLRVGREGDPATGRYRFSGRVADTVGPIAGATVAILRRTSGSGGAAEAEPLDRERDEPVALASTDARGIYLVAVSARELFAGVDGTIELRAVFDPSTGTHLAAVSEGHAVGVPAPPGVPARWYLVAMLWVLSAVVVAQAVRLRAWQTIAGMVRGWPRAWCLDRAHREARAHATSFVTPDGEAARRTTWIAGRVTDAHSSQIIRGASVLAHGPEGQELRPRPDADGRFALGPLGGGHWTLELRARGYLARDASAEIPHDGGLDGATFPLVAVRRRIRDLYAATLGAFRAHMRWGRDTPAEALARAGITEEPSRAALSELRALVERSWFALPPAEEPEARRAESLRDRALGGRP